MIRAAFVGLFLAITGCFLLAFLHGAMGGTHATFDERLAHGAELSSLVAFAVTPFLFIVAVVVLADLGVRLFSHWPTRSTRYF